MEIGSVSEIERLEHILLTHPDSYWSDETIMSSYVDGKLEDKVINRKRCDISSLKGLLNALESYLKGEGVKTTSLYFYPKSGHCDVEEEDNIMILPCNPHYLSLSLRDYGIFTKKQFLYIDGREEGDHGDSPRAFASAIKRKGIKTYKTDVEGGSFVSDGRFGILSEKFNGDFQKLLEWEFEEFLYLPDLNIHVDSLVSFLNKDTFIVNYDLVKQLETDLEWWGCRFDRIFDISKILKKEGYSEIKINDAYNDYNSFIVGSILNLGDDKLVLTDPENEVEKKLVKEGFDITNLNEFNLRILIHCQAGLRCITLPVKRNY